MKKLKRVSRTNRIPVILIIAGICTACSGGKDSQNRVAVASAGDAVLYLDEIPAMPQSWSSKDDSISFIQNYANKWAKKTLVLSKAEENLSPELKNEIDRQLDETRADLLIYQYQRQMMLEKMDTIVKDSDLEDYYNANQASFLLSTSIVKGLLVKLPVETPNPDKIRQLVQSTTQTDLQELETQCYQFADKNYDYSEEWVPLDRMTVELPQDIENEEYFLRWTKYHEVRDSSYIYMFSIRDFRLRSTTAPFEYVRNDIKRIIWNNRRIQFIENLENGIYNDALKQNKFRLF